MILGYPLFPFGSRSLFWINIHLIRTEFVVSILITAVIACDRAGLPKYVDQKQRGNVLTLSCPPDLRPLEAFENGLLKPPRAPFARYVCVNGNKFQHIGVSGIKSTTFFCSDNVAKLCPRMKNDEEGTLTFYQKSVATWRPKTGGVQILYCVRGHWYCLNYKSLPKGLSIIMSEEIAAAKFQDELSADSTREPALIQENTISIIQHPTQSFKSPQPIKILPDLGIQRETIDRKNLSVIKSLLLKNSSQSIPAKLRANNSNSLHATNLPHSLFSRYHIILIKMEEMKDFFHWLHNPIFATALTLIGATTIFTVCALTICCIMQKQIATLKQGTDATKTAIAQKMPTF